MSQYRYPGAQPFTAQEEKQFYGRDTDVKQLMQMLLVQQLVVLYSKSGLGKSSLINAGIVPKISEEMNYHPISLRLGAWIPDQTERPLSVVKQRLLKGFKKEGFLDDIIPQENSLWYCAKMRQIHSNGRPIILLFDQFEELFTYPFEQIEQFKTELAELLTTGVPQRFRQMLDVLNATNPNLLTAEEEDLLYDPIKLKVLIAIRSDKLHLMNRLSDHLPNILLHSYELQALSREDAKLAIVRPAAQEGNFISPPFSYTQEVLENVLIFLTDRENRIESIQLQILCHSFEEKVRLRQIRTLNNRNMGDLEDILANYYNNKINLIGDKTQQLAARRLIEEGLVLEDERQRTSMHEGQIQQFFKVSPALLKTLVDTHLLRAEPTERGYSYELSHDTLILPVLEAKQKRLQEEEAEKARLERELEMERLRQEALKERRKRTRAILIAFAGVVLAAMTTIAFFYAQDQKEIAQEQRDKAIEAQERSDRDKKLAEEARNLAKFNENQANQQREKAVEAQQLAETAKLKAEANERKAIVNLLLFNASNDIEKGKQSSALHYLYKAWSYQSNASEIQRLLYRIAPAIRIPEAPHDATIEDGVFLPESSDFLTVGADRYIKLWNKNGQLQEQRIGHSKAIKAIALIDNQHIVTASLDSTLRIWSTSLRLKNSLRTDESLEWLATSAQSQRIAAIGTNGTLFVWNLNGTLLNRRNAHRKAISDLSFSADGEYLISASEDQTVKLWDKDGQLLKNLEVHQSPITAAKFAPNGTLFLSASGDEKNAQSDNQLILWNLEGEIQQQITMPSATLSASFSPDGQTVLSTGFDGLAKRWNLDGQLLGTAVAHKSQKSINASAYAPYGNLIVTNSTDGYLAIWDKEGQLKKEFFHGYPLQEVLFSPDGNRILGLGTSNFFKLWATSGKDIVQQRLHQGLINHLALSLDGKTLLTVGEDQKAILWNTQTGERIRRLSGHGDPINFGAFHNNDKEILTVSEDKTARLWNTSSGKSIQVFEHGNLLSTGLLLMNGKKVATVDQDGYIKIWSKASGELLSTIKLHDSSIKGLLPYAKGTRIASIAEEPQLKIWNCSKQFSLVTSVELGEVPKQIFYSNKEQVIIAVLSTSIIKITPDGTILSSLPIKPAVQKVAYADKARLLATTDIANRIRLWKQDGTLISTLAPDKQEIANICLSPDGTLLATTNYDGVIQIYPLSPNMLFTQYRKQLNFHVPPEAY